MMIKEQLLADPLSEKIIITYNQPRLCSTGTLCYYNVTEDNNNIIAQGGREGERQDLKIATPLSKNKIMKITFIG
jgi:hypothetical protein